MTIENQISEMEEKIEAITNNIAEIQAEMDNFELDPDDCEEQYQEALREGGDPVIVCGLKFDPVRILQEMDPTAYRCGLFDYIHSIDKADAPKYIELTEQLEDLEAELTDLEDV